ncbi:hypothetical protein BU25DRAFT_230903 [Macroventuria anomochaeta]|uniref:Uncharacterized protein n=1 Tax=Macroventuria anomochaeta TaxID=301207 RepID=A0ACB6RIQ9_9PLEO|nr:uncharacterized protein BU25DRAFT_230903 [Macroventuria anomochaeta]KAF2621795.1 hypothetical protein BU25DRAFT_230903 [Macroventuria anomochaeta]
MVTKLTAEVNNWRASRQKEANEAKEDEKRRRNETRRLSEIRGRLTPEQKAMNDDWQSLVDLYTDLSQESTKATRRCEEAASELEEFSDVEVPESPLPSVHSTDRLIGSSVDLVEETFGPSKKWTGAIVGSSAIPMGMYRPGKHPMTGLHNPEHSEDRQGDDQDSCWGWGFWCWNWGLWGYLGCEPRDDTSHGQIESSES